MTKWKNIGLTLGLLASASQSALAGGLYTNGVPPAGGSQYPLTLPLTGSETFPADTNLSGGQAPQSEAISVGQLTQAGNAYRTGDNLLVGGDASTNLFQRGTTGASVTTTATYGGPDRWFYWSGTGTAMTVSRSTTASDVPAGYSAAFKMARTASQTGVVQMCMAQVVESQYAVKTQGQTVELDFQAYDGANFSAANQNITAYVVTGTGTDEGSAKMAFGLNAGGGGSTSWTGQANATAAVIGIGPVSTAGRYAAVANIPATATEIGVALCWTPVGTAGAADYVAFTGIQLKTSQALASYANASVGYVAGAAGAPQLSLYVRKEPEVEAVGQYRYYYQLTEGTPINIVANCSATSTTVALCLVQYPVPMRAVPTVAYTTGFATPTTTAGSTLGACSALATSTVVASSALSTYVLPVTCTATTVPAAGSATFLYSNGGSGAIKVSADL